MIAKKADTSVWVKKRMDASRGQRGESRKKCMH